MKKKLKLFNHFHNGDIFFSRMMIQSLSKFYDIEFYHNLNKPLLDDIENLDEIIGIPSYLDPHDHFSKKINDGYINTWLGQGKMIYTHQKNQGCTFENHMCVVQDVCNYLGIHMEEVDNYLPVVNFTKLKNYESITEKMMTLRNKFDKIILISNGDVHSSQSVNFDFNPIIDFLIRKFPNFLFLTTQNTNIISENLINTSSITDCFPDLTYITLISTFSDVIVGRTSGPFCFAQCKENLLDDKKTFISFSDTFTEAKFFQNSKCKFIWSNNYAIENIINTIKLNIE